MPNLNRPPPVNLDQGPLCHQALAALDAITTYVESCPGAASAAAALQQQQRQQQQGAGGGAAREAAATRAAAAAAGASDPRALVACVLPQLDVGEALRRVLDGCGAPPKKRKFKLLPFVGGGAGDPSRRFTDE
ncbi:hypothetical protein MNEG_4999 [Monoraphidium neglectum]|uniref:Uncharacterized protein n=1 Tax=Monoraphidium neglectum TaxID=145388 RepID=A0A0D2L7X4_9CHLO|nr:hypothetical protein MNEG_4999 [Monoraphidium neglectum]KIZ02964.1 hypothetical protein MNEG_4999 [Monoraphidium neglectum]|eukprot:XP_013901983.1 hypothetical protein MNEG_4999 [Monoraphidium neglectum]